MGTLPVLQIDGLLKTFDGVHALRNAHFELRPGEVHALVGENGAGKSTLIKILSGMHAADAGRLRMDGRVIDIDSPAASRRHGIAVIYQDFDLPPNLTVADALLLGQEPAGPLGFIRFGEYRRRARRCLDNIGLDLDIRLPVEKLSIARRQLVAIARAVSTNARVLIMDEPTSSLASDETGHLLQLIARLREAGTSIIYISHKLEEVFAVADRITVFRDGATIGTRDAGTVSENEIVSMMVGRNLADLFAGTRHRPGDILLEVSGICRRGVFAESGFSLHEGEILGLYGLKGAGRSEMMRSLFGLDPLDGGEIRLRGRAVNIDSPRAAMAYGFAFVPEDRQVQGLFPNMSVSENMSIACMDNLADAGFIRRTRERRTVTDYIARLNIRADRMDQPVLSLSGGNQQKVILARWLINKPRVLILDEPTAGVDVGAKSEIYRVISELAADGMGVILVSSELPEILGMSDRILVMHAGRLAGEFSRQEATEEKIMQSVYAR